MKLLKEIRVPKESVNDEFLNVVAIPFKNGDKVSKAETILELETSKAIITVEAEEDGYVEYLCNIGSEVKVNSVIIKIWNEFNLEEKNVLVVEDEIKLESSKIKTNELINTIYSNKAIKLIEENKIDKDYFGNLDFVNDEIILSYINKNEEPIVNEEQIPFRKSLEKNISSINNEKVNIVKLTNSKKREIEYLSEVQYSGLVSIINIDIDIEDIFENINKSLNYFTNSSLPIIVYECSRLLLKYPVFNSYFSNGEILQYKDVNIGIAMDIDNGLKVVNLRNTNKRNLRDIDNDIYDLALKYMEKKLTTNDLQEITFTITDLSSYGVYSFNPLINKNNSAILGISKIDKKLNRIILSLAFDHRVTEGKMAAFFLQELKERIESYKLNDYEHNKNIICYKCLKSLNEDLNDIGFIKILNKKKQETYICDSCLLKF